MTPQEHKALSLIAAHVAQHGYPPTQQQIAEGLGLKSKSGAHRLIHSLARQGLLEVQHGRRQGVELGRLPNVIPQSASCPHCGGALRVSVEGAT